MNSICVFCGSSTGSDPAYAGAAKQLGGIITAKKLKLVYGGGSVGLMGVLADEVLKNNGHVTGVIPRFLYDLEVGHKGVTQLVIVGSMHERKQKMAELSDAFVAMPGGYGTLEELAEILTWVQLGLVRKPIGLLNINGYFDPLLDFFDRMVTEKFLNLNNRHLLLSSTDPALLLESMRNSIPEAGRKWIDREKT